MLPTLLFVTTVIGGFVTALFVISLIIKRNDIADIAWGPGIAIATWSAWFFNGSPDNLLTLTVLTLTTIWAARLGIRIFQKNQRNGEDARYARWREAWGTWFYFRSYLQVYLLQGSLMILLGMSGIVASTAVGDTPLGLLFFFGLAIWITGFLLEATSDHQLDTFLRNPDNKGRLMRYGLWTYSRHPNYFGEVIMWWGIWLIVLPVPLALIALISPVTITTLILFVSGIPLLEAGLAKHPEFAEYKRTTSVFIPWWPKR